MLPYSYRKVQILRAVRINHDAIQRRCYVTVGAEQRRLLSAILFFIPFTVQLWKGISTGDRFALSSAPSLLALQLAFISNS